MDKETFLWHLTEDDHNDYPEEEHPWDEIDSYYPQERVYDVMVALTDYLVDLENKQGIVDLNDLWIIETNFDPYEIMVKNDRILWDECMAFIRPFKERDDVIKNGKVLADIIEERRK